VPDEGGGFQAGCGGLVKKGLYMWRETWAIRGMAVARGLVVFRLLEGLGKAGQSGGGGGSLGGGGKCTRKSCGGSAVRTKCRRRKRVRVFRGGWGVYGGENGGGKSAGAGKPGVERGAACPAELFYREN